MSGMTRWLGGSERNCGSFINTLVLRVRLDLSDRASPSGDHLVKHWASELGLSPDEVATFLILREVARASEPERSRSSLILPF